MMTKRNRYLASSIRAAIHTMGIIAASASVAQAANEPVQLDEVVVTGIRASIQKSIETKREADAIVDAITAEDIGKFPDKNVAESLQRVPGVSISRTNGEGEKVSIRGTEPKLNRTLLDGHAVATADWFILDQNTGSRSFNYLMLPSESVGTLEVYKSPQANIDEGGIGGTVIVHTRNPLDMDPLVLNGSLQAEYNDLVRKTNPQLSGIVSWHNDDKTLGVMAGAIKQKREVRRDAMVVLGFDVSPIDVLGGGDYDINGMVGPGYFRQTRDRKGGNLAVQWKPTDDFELDFKGMYFRMDANNFENTYLSYPVNALSWHGLQPTAATARSNYITSMAVPADPDPNTNIDNWGAVYDALLRDAYTNTNSLDVSATWNATDKLTLTGRVGSTRGVGATEQQIFLETGGIQGFSYDTRGPVPSVRFQNNPALASSLPDVTTFFLDGVTSVDKEAYGFLDATYDVDAGFFKSLKFGGKFTRHQRNNQYFDQDLYSALKPGYNTSAPFTFCGANGTTVTTNTITPPSGYHACGLPDFSTGGVTPSNFMSRYQIGTNAFALADADRMRAIADSITNRGTGSNVAYMVYPRMFDIVEKVYGGYVMGSFGGDNWRGNAGVRVVKTKEHTQGWQVNAPDNAPGLFVDSFYGNVAPVYTDHDYTDVLPSVNFTYDIQPELLARLTVAKVMARADYAQLQPGLGLNVNQLRASSGNPTLDPFRATTLNGSLEWYFGRESLLAATLFYMDIKNYITSRVYLERHVANIFDPSSPTSQNTISSGNCVPAGSATLFTCTFQVTRPSNGFGGKNKGIELTYPQAIWGGFGAMVNYTYADAKSDSGDVIPGNSEHTANVTAYFENQSISARLSYNYRSEYYDSDYWGGKVWADPQKYLDGSFAYTINEHVSLNLDATNLLDEVRRTHYNQHDWQPFETSYTGREFYAGVRLKF